MIGRLLILARHIQRRIDNGEKLDAILNEYKLLQESEKQEILLFLSSNQK